MKPRNSRVHAKGVCIAGEPFSRGIPLTSSATTPPGLWQARHTWSLLGHPVRRGDVSPPAGQGGGPGTWTACPGLRASDRAPKTRPRHGCSVHLPGPTEPGGAWGPHAACSLSPASGQTQPGSRCGPDRPPPSLRHAGRALFRERLGPTEPPSEVWGRPAAVAETNPES